MAMMDEVSRKNGIQLGGPLDYCEVCSAKIRRNNYGELEYKEVFKFYRNGNSICFCMDHFKSMLGHYLLVDINEEIKDEEDITLDNIEDEEDIALDNIKDETTTDKSKDKKEIAKKTEPKKADSKKNKTKK